MAKGMREKFLRDGTFSFSQMSRAELARAMPWRENVCNKTNVFVQPDEQSRACSSYAMAKKRL